MTTHTIKTHTLESLRARCVEEGDCLIWQGYSANNTPQVYMAGPTSNAGHNGRPVSVRWLMALLDGDAEAAAEQEPGARRGFWVATCGVIGCVAPQHRKRLSKHKMMKHAQQAAVQDSIGNALRIERIRRTRRAQAGKVDMATMRAAVASPRPAAHVARDIGVSKTSVARWRRRAAARVTTGVWGQLIAR